MLIYPKLDPIALSLGPLKIHWYGLMYLFGFVMAWLLCNYRAKRSNGLWTKEQVGDVIFYGALGVILGGRIGYILFYDLGNFIHNPLVIFQVWDGGMSFHGGLIGVILALMFCGRKFKKTIFELTDFVAPVVPIGLGAGRIGNFINDELWGRVTDSSIGMVFPTGGPLPRYPSQLIEFLFEGVILFIILWWYSSKPRPRMAVSALFLLFYGIFRFGAEFLRQPDPQMGYIAFGWMTMGQILSVPMIVLGLLLYWFAQSRAKRLGV